MQARDRGGARRTAARRGGSTSRGRPSRTRARRGAGAHRRSTRNTIRSIARPRAPVALEPLHDDLLARVPLTRTRTARCRPDGPGSLAPLRDRGRRHHRVHREIAEQRRVRARDVDLDRRGIDRHDPGDALQQASPVDRVLAAQVVAGGPDRAAARTRTPRPPRRTGCHRGTRRWRGAGTSTPGRPRTPARWSRGRAATSVVPGSPADEALEHQAADLDRLAVGDADRIEGLDIRRARDHERPRIAPTRRAPGIAGHDRDHQAQAGQPPHGAATLPQRNSDGRRLTLGFR